MLSRDSLFSLESRQLFFLHQILRVIVENLSKFYGKIVAGDIENISNMLCSRLISSWLFLQCGIKQSGFNRENIVTCRQAITNTSYLHSKTQKTYLQTYIRADSHSQTYKLTDKSLSHIHRLTNLLTSLYPRCISVNLGILKMEETLRTQSKSFRDLSNSHPLVNVTSLLI